MTREFLGFVSRPLLSALSRSYQQGTHLDDKLEDTASAFKKELAVGGDPIAALDRLSEEDSICLLTIHKCKGLEFEKVVVMGVETQLFFGSAEVVKSEFFAAISRAKDELAVTHAEHRSRPADAPTRGSEQRTAYAELLAYAEEL